MVARNGHLSKLLLLILSFLCPSPSWVTTPLRVKSRGDNCQTQFFEGTFWESCKLAFNAGQSEAGSSSLDVEGSRTRPAEILFQNWEFGKPVSRRIREP